MNDDTSPHTGPFPGAHPGGHLDGNAMAGPLSAVFATDLTAAVAVCAGCGHTAQVAALPVFGAPMGLVARCPDCDHVLLSYTELPAGRTLQMPGLEALRLPAAR